MLIIIREPRYYQDANLPLPPIQSIQRLGQVVVLEETVQGHLSFEPQQNDVSISSWLSES